MSGEKDTQNRRRKMSSVEFKLISNDELIKGATDEAIQTALEAVGMQAQGYATDACPVETGRLKSSIDFEVEDGVLYLGTNVEYAPYIEFGTGEWAENGGGRPTPWVWKDREGNWHWTKGMRAKPFLRPAFEKHLPEYQQIFEEILSKVGN